MDNESKPPFEAYVNHNSINKMWMRGGVSSIGVSVWLCRPATAGRLHPGVEVGPKGDFKVLCRNRVSPMSSLPLTDEAIEAGKERGRRKAQYRTEGIRLDRKLRPCANCGDRCVSHHTERWLTYPMGVEAASVLSAINRSRSGVINPSRQRSPQAK